MKKWYKQFIPNSEEYVIVMQIDDVKFFVPMDESNKDYQEYLKWVAEGNTAEEVTE